MMLRKLDKHMQRNEIGPHLMPLTKINSQWIKDFNIKFPKLSNKRKGNTGKKLLDISLGNDFLDKTIKPQANKTKTKQA